MKKWRIFIIMALAAVIAVSTLVFPLDNDALDTY